MLRSALLIALVAASVPAVAAAEPSELTDQTRVGADRLELGAVVGASFMGLHGEVTAQVAATGGESRPVPLQTAGGFLAGGFVELGLTEHLALRVEGYYAWERAAADVSLGAGGVPFTGASGISIEYLRSSVEIPVLAVWRIAYDGRFVPRLFAGPYLGLGLSGSVAGQADIVDPMMMGNDVMFDASGDLDDDIERVQVGVAGGGSMTFPIGVGELVAQVRYHAGITTAVSAHEVQLMGGAATVSGEELRDRGLVLILGYQL
jgi:hypothetical protein